VAEKKEINIVYYAFVSVALVIQQAKRMGHIVICGLSFSTIFFNIFPHYLQLSKKDIEHKMCDFLYKFCMQNFSL